MHKEVRQASKILTSATFILVHPETQLHAVEFIQTM